MNITKEQANDLAVLGRITLANGVTLTLQQEPDDIGLGDFGDCYGRVEWVRPNPYTGHVARPDGFDGRAEKISTQRDTYWWQPPADIPNWYTNPETRRFWRRTVRDILEYGFSVVTVIATRECDGCGNPDEIGRTSLGGIEPLLDADDMADYVRDMVLDLADELESVPA